MSEQFAEGTELWRRAAGYGMEGFSLDATDVEAATRGFAKAIEKVRTTSRPVLIEAHTLRLRGHAAYDTCDYMKPGESDAYFARDPLPRFRATLAARGLSARLDAIDAELNAFIEQCITISLAVPKPDAAGMEQDLFAPPAAPLPWKPEPAAPLSLNLAQALNAALRKILTERPESIVLGQDIGAYGGAFKVTDNLLTEFGRPRVFNTPLAESACTGYAIGMAVNGHRPIEEFQFADFATEAVTQITQNAATYYFRSGAACPMVLRFPCGTVQLGSFHSQELESMFLSIPGIKGLYPSTPQDAFDALLAAYEDGNPVILFENKALYRCKKQPVVWNPNYRDVWNPKRLRQGDSATLVAYGEIVHTAEEVCDYFSGEYEFGFDLFDLRGLSPLRLDAIDESVARTGRLVVLHEGRRTLGFGAELVARLTERHFAKLKSPPLRIGAADLPVPFAPELEEAFLPTKEKIVEQITAWMG
jgi:2-oxoisovalerate dehydrogenase E1 component